MPTTKKPTQKKALTKTNKAKPPALEAPRKRNAAAKKRKPTKIPKNIDNLNLSPALTPAQRRQQASVDQQTRYGASKKKKKK